MLLAYLDQKKEIVSLFPDIAQSQVIHSCSADRSICTYDLQQEKRTQMRQTANGFHTGMSQRRDNELELVTGGSGSPIFFWDCDEAQPVA
jgi:hypothetical protein